MGKPHATDWEVTRDPVRNKQIERQVEADLRDEARAKQRFLEREKERQERLANNGIQWLKLQGQCKTSIENFETDIITRKNAWSNVAIDFASAYEQAWNLFSKAFSDAEKCSSDMWNLAFLALNMCAAGGIAVMCEVVGSKVWKTNAAKELLISGTSDSIQAGVGGLLPIAAGALATEYADAPIPSPSQYGGELTKILNNMENDMLAWCKALRNEIERMPLERFEFYKPEELDRRIAEFWKRKEAKFHPRPITKRMVFELEKAMWARWCVDNLVVDRGAVSRFFRGQFVRLEEPIVERLIAVGFLSRDEQTPVGPSRGALFWLLTRVTMHIPPRFGT